MFYLILIVLFIAVFAFIFWRVIRGQAEKKAHPPIATYVCPQCNESDCECQKMKENQQ